MIKWIELNDVSILLGKDMICLQKRRTNGG